MYGNQQYQYGQQLQAQQGRHINGIQIDSYDQSTFCPSLPMQNDRVPQVPNTQFLANGGGQLFGLALGIFRLKLQERAARGGLYTYAYNLISHQHWNNPIYAQWGADIAMFVEFLLVVQPQTNNPQQAPAKVAEIMYRAFYADVASQVPQLAQESIGQNQQAGNELNHAAQQLGAIRNDLNVYRQRVLGGQQYGQQQHYGQQHQYGSGPGQHLPPINAGYQQGGYAPAPNSGLNAAGVSGMASLQPTTQQFNTTSTGAAAGIDYGGGAVTEPLKPASSKPGTLQPVESYGVSLPPAGQSITPPVQATPVMEETDTTLPIPANADEVVMDPHAYVPKGVVIDMERPMDVIYSPGGIETRPAYLTDWKLTKSDSRPYGQVMDPTRGVRYYTKFPDGVVQERFVEYTEMMDYQKHEINIALRNAAFRSNGLLTMTSQEINRSLEGTATIEEVVKLPVEDRGETSPVKLPICFSGSTERENENDARLQLAESLGVQPGAKLPAHEYESVFTHPIDVTEEISDRLIEVAEFKSLGSVAKELVRLLEANDLSVRDFTFINQRLTAGVNSFLRDRLSSGTKISDFSTDAPELEDYLRETYGAKYVEYLRTATPTILGQNFSVSRDDNGVTSLSDYNVTLQTGWTLRELTDAEVGDEAQLVSAVTHPVVVQAISGILRRNQGEVRHSHHLRMVTVDGNYLEIVRGLLMDSAYLLKRIS